MLRRPRKNNPPAGGKLPVEFALAEKERAATGSGGLPDGSDSLRARARGIEPVANPVARRHVHVRSRGFPSPANAHLAEDDAITRAIYCYIAGARAGDASRDAPCLPCFGDHPRLLPGRRIQPLGRARVRVGRRERARPSICPRFARIEIIETIAVVHLEVEHWSGKLAGANARASDVFTLLKWDGEWKITHKVLPLACSMII